MHVSGSSAIISPENSYGDSRRPAERTHSSKTRSSIDTNQIPTMYLYGDFSDPATKVPYGERARTALRGVIFAGAFVVSTNYLATRPSAYAITRHNMGQMEKLNLDIKGYIAEKWPRHSRQRAGGHKLKQVHRVRSSTLFAPASPAHTVWVRT